MDTKRMDELRVAIDEHPDRYSMLRNSEILMLIESAKREAGLREALEMIAELRQCPDNLMSNLAIARQALKENADA